MLDDQIVSSVAIGNLKAISEQPSMLSNLAYSNVVATNNLGQQNAVSNQQAGNEIGISLVAKATNTVSDLDPLEARSAVDILSNNELAQTIADLKASVQAFAGSDGTTPKDVWAMLRALIKAGVKVDKDGYIVVPAGETIIVPGQYAKEDIQVTLQNDAVLIKVNV